MIKKTLFLAVLVLFGAKIVQAGFWGADVTPVDLKCEALQNPLGIDQLKPRLSWRLETRKGKPERGLRQVAYRILVATEERLLKEGKADFWDSGKVNSGKSIGVEYAGKPLASCQRYFWKVKVFTTAGNAWSEAAWWETALLSQGEWGAKWICQDKPLPEREADFYKDHPAPLLRKSFQVTKKVRRARAYISGLGYYELRINGKKVGDHMLDPGWTAYGKRVLYSTYDVTAALRPGENAAGVILGNGWYNPLPLRMWGHLNLRQHLALGRPRLIAEIHVDYEDGSSERIVSDEQWKTADSPILRNSVYLGEVYDARRERASAGWDQPGFDDRSWKNAVLAGSQLGALRCQSAPPIRVCRVIKPVAVTEPVPGIFVFDLGENVGGTIRMRLRGSEGRVVTATCGELLYPDGRVNARTSACGQIKKNKAPADADGVPENAFHRYRYILSGQGDEVYTARFAFSGFRYVEVEGLPGRPAADSLDGLVMHSDVSSAGSFECSNELFNRIQDAFRRTLLSNMFSVESDCPHREKFGYGGDIVACSEAAVYNFDMSTFYAKAVDDLLDSVRANGGFTETAPFVGIADGGLGDGAGPVLWGTAHPVLQERLLAFYGNERVLAEQYDASQRWFGLLAAKANDNVVTSGLGDHESLAPQSPEVCSTAYYFHTALMFADICRRLGKTDEAARYAVLADRIRSSFNRRFIDPQSGRCKDGTQANQSFALALGLVPDALREPAVKILIDDVIQRKAGHLSTGIFGTDCLLQALSKNGRVDTAYTVVNQKTFPGWGYMIENGATTLWEHWAKDDNTFSHNHPMFGSVSAWFFKYLAGIRLAEGASGFDSIVIAPLIPVGLDWVKCHHDSPYGRIVSNWKRDGQTLMMEIVVPPNTTAIVHVPAKMAAEVTESGKEVRTSRGVKFLREENGAAVFAVGSGCYRFASNM